MQKRMPTPFGINLRKLRVDHDETLYQMSQKIGVSPAFLSSVELGKKSVPSGLISDISRRYGLSDESSQKLQCDADRSVGSVKIDLKGCSEFDRSVILTFSKSYQDLPESKKSLMFELLQSES